MRRLVVGIGNRLRGDDGIGPMLAEELPGRLPLALRRDLQVRCVQQLLPELSSEIAAVEAVLFIDAWQPSAGAPQRGHGPWLQPLGDELQPGPFSHDLDAASVVRLCALLHGCSPRAAQLLVPASHFPHGAHFSPQLRRQLPAARALLQSWCRQSLESGSHA